MRKEKVSKIANADPGKREKSSIVREIIVESFLIALSKTANFVNIKACFRATGISPSDLEAPLSSQFALEAPDPQLIQGIGRGNDLNSQELTSEQGLNFLAHKVRNRSVQEGDFIINYKKVLSDLRAKSAC